MYHLSKGDADEISSIDLRALRLVFYISFQIYVFFMKVMVLFEDGLLRSLADGITILHGEGLPDGVLT